MKSDDLLTRRVDKVLPSRKGLARLMSQRKIRLYQGFDPTGARLHLGHSIGLRKLMEFATAGHEVIFLFGTGTVLVGDPSQRDRARKLITQAEIEENIQDWKRQAESIVDFEQVSIKKNGDWLVPLSLKDFVNIASNISAVQLFKREMFQRRLDRGETVWYHETMYPLLQGYDSVAMDVDLEIGGSDQEFNMLVGRELMRKMKGKEKFVLTIPMILGTDGKPMSKTSGNCIWLTDSADEMFGKLMRIPDEQIVPYIEFLTDIPLSRVDEVRAGLLSGAAHPMEAKQELAIAVVTQFHGAAPARQAKDKFEKTFQQGQTPADMPTLRISSLPNNPSVVDVLTQGKLVGSRGEARRLVKQGGVNFAGAPITDINYSFKGLTGILQAGKRRWLKLI